MPSYVRRLAFTKLLVLVSILGSLGSSFTLLEGWGELYPFANWKLFTQPRGSNREYDTYRIYTRQPGESVFTRQRVRATSTFDPDDYVYTLESLVNRTLADTSQDAKARAQLHALVKHLHPTAQDFRIVREKATLNNLLHHPQQYEADTVVRF